MAHYFAMVGLKDNPIYEADLSHRDVASSLNKNEEHKHLNQFIVHGSLDIVEDIMWSTKDLYLKSVDKFNDWQISAYVTPSYVKLLLLHNGLGDDVIRTFFVEVHELYTKILLNPFYEADARIHCPIFNQKVFMLSKKYF